MRLIATIITLVILSGCSHVRPYAELGLAYQLDNNSHWHVRKNRNWQCDNGLQGHMEAGAIYPMENGALRLGYHHQSWVNCGKPQGNGRAELYQDDIRLVYQHTF